MIASERNAHGVTVRGPQATIRWTSTAVLWQRFWVPILVMVLVVMSAKSANAQSPVPPPPQATAQAPSSAPVPAPAPTPPAATAAATPANESTERIEGNYAVQQSIEFGYRD